MGQKILIVWLLAIVAGAVQAATGTVAPPDRGVAYPAPDARRIALVIGNGAYAAEPLGNPARDAAAVSQALRALGFEVSTYTDQDAEGMKAAIADFGRRLQGGGAGLFYFAGHGLRVAGQTLLAPVDADGRSPARVVNRSIPLQAVLDDMARPRPGQLNLVILDTCLDDPFRPGPQTGMESLPGQTLLALATAPGALAWEGAAGLGRYTEVLLRALAEPDQDVTRLFQRVALHVRQASGGGQQPQVLSSLTGEFRLGSLPPGGGWEARAAQGPLLLAQSRGILPKDSAEQYELTFWESIKDSEHVSDYEAYLKAYPNGRFVPLAKARIERLKAAQKTETPKPSTPPAAAPTPAPPAAAPTPAPARPPEKPATAAPERPRPPAPAAAPAADKATPVTSGAEIKDCPACPALIGLRQGEFVMGNNNDDPSERPAHPVSVPHPFAMGKYEVTNEQWNACVDTGGCPRLASGADAPKNAPVRDVSWDDAQAYVKWLSKTTGKAYRLPTETEWEYAARGGTTTRYWWGDKMATGKANCKVCGDPWNQDGPATVGSFAPNPYGIYDMNGSVWEWVADCWHSSYKGAPADGRVWDEPNCRVRVIRGGSWREGADYMLSSTRFKYDATVRQSQNGFRVARDLP